MAPINQAACTLEIFNKPVFTRRGSYSFFSCSSSSCQYSWSLLASRSFTTVHFVTLLSVHLVNADHPNNGVTKSSCNAIQQDESTVWHYTVQQAVLQSQWSFCGKQILLLIPINGDTIFTFFHSRCCQVLLSPINLTQSQQHEIHNKLYTVPIHFAKHISKFQI